MSEEQTPPQITSGSFVSWDGGEGRVDLIVTTGKVPGVSDDVEATSDSPAARVVVWKDGKATSEKIGASTHTLKRIAPLDGADERKHDPAAALVAIHGQHERLLLDMGDGHSMEVAVTGGAVKTAYDRGIESWPGREVAGMDREDWALGRAAHLCKAARGEVDVTNDADLLAPEHPLRVSATEPTEGPADEPVEEGDADGEVSLDVGDVEAMLAGIDEAAALPDPEESDEE